MTKKTRTTGDDTRARIIEAARELFTEQGYTATSISAISKRAGVLPGSLYWAFESKEKLFAETVRVVAEEFKKRILPTFVLEGLDRDAMRHSFLALAEPLREIPETTRLTTIIAIERQAGDPEVIAAARDVHDFWLGYGAECFAAHLEHLDAADRDRISRRIARLMLLIIDGSRIEMAIEPGGFSSEEILLEAADVLHREIVWELAQLNGAEA